MVIIPSSRYKRCTTLFSISINGKTSSQDIKGVLLFSISINGKTANGVVDTKNSTS
jgi:hypothetical protein